MSRIGKRITAIPAGVTVTESGRTLTVKGPRGELELEIPEHINCVMGKDSVQFTVEPAYAEALNVVHGTTTARFANLVEGVTQGFAKHLEIVGVGYRSSVEAGNLSLYVGYSHPVIMRIPDGIKVEVTDNTKILISGADAVNVGQFAQNVRKERLPDHYKGKGIRYASEKVRIKAGKKALSGA